MITAYVPLESLTDENLYLTMVTKNGIYQAYLA